MMTQRFVLSSDFASGVDTVQDWMDFNGIQYQRQAFWDQHQQRFSWPDDIEHAVVVMNHRVFRSSVSLAHSRQELLDLCDRHNQVVVLGMDSAVSVMADMEILRQFGTCVCPNSVVLVLDAQSAAPGWPDLGNITIGTMPANWFMQGVPRCQAPSSIKTSATHDYLLTMLLKPHRPHRDVLWHELQQRPALLSRGLVSCRHITDDATWIGRGSRVHEWPDGHASMDLYLDCWMSV